MMQRVYNLIRHSIKQNYHIIIAMRMANNFLERSNILGFINNISVNRFREPAAPSTLLLETHNYCNSKCIMCGYPYMKRTKGFMDENLFHKIVDEAAEMKVEYISLNFYNEPLLDKRLFTFIEYIKKKGLKVGFTTNASLMTKDIIEKIIQKGVDQITVSFDGIDKETYEHIRKGLSFEQVSNNLLTLVKLREEFKSKLPKIALTFVIINLNRNETKTFYDFWRGKVDEINLNLGQNFYSINSNIFFNSKNSEFKTPCKYLWSTLPITWDGKGVLCCNDYDALIVLGNLKDESLHAIWNSHMKRYRTMHKKGLRNKIHLCKKCPLYSIWF